MKASPGPDPARAAAETVLDGVPAVMRAIRGHMREGRAEGMSVPQFRALLYLRRNAGSDLSSMVEHLGTSMGAGSELVSRLVRDGLVVRRTDPVSRRRVRLALSPEGERQLAEARERTLEWLAAQLAGVPPDRLAQIAEMLVELRQAVEADEG